MQSNRPLWKNLLILAAVFHYGTAKDAPNRVTDFHGKLDESYELYEVTKFQLYNEIVKTTHAFVFGIANNTDESLSIHIWPPEQCLEVTVGSFTGDLKTGYAYNEEHFFKGEKLIFRSMEYSIGKYDEYNKGPIGDPIDSTRATTSLHFKVKEDDGVIYTIPSKDSEDGETDRGDGRISILFNKSMVAMTSSPHCQVSVEKKGGSAVPTYILRHNKADNTSKIQNKYIENKKTDVIIAKSSSSRLAHPTDSCCVKIWSFNGFAEVVEKRLASRINYMSYKFSANEKRTKKQSVYLQAQEPENCKWARVCFGSSKDEIICKDDQTSVEILYVHGLFIRTDNDQAQQFGVPQVLLDTIEFRFKNDSVLELAYGGRTGRGEPHLFEHMALKDFNITDPDARIHLSSDAGCLVGFIQIEENAEMFPNDEDRQGLTVENCECHNPLTH